VTEGFASHEARKEMLEQFMRVDGQDWARDLLHDLHGEP